MDIERIQQQAEETAKKYNPDGLSPFPFNNIQNDHKDLKIFITEDLEPEISGVIVFTQDTNIFSILINKNKPATRQQFTIAHELGHYFLHASEIKNELFIDKDLDTEGMLFRTDTAASTQLEKEANNFAASLLMPTDLVKKVWIKLQNVEECAELFNVSVLAMSIRLSRLGLLN